MYAQHRRWHQETRTDEWKTMKSSHEPSNRQGDTQREWERMNLWCIEPRQALTQIHKPNQNKWLTVERGIGKFHFIAFYLEFARLFFSCVHFRSAFHPWEGNESDGFCFFFRSSPCIWCVVAVFFFVLCSFAFIDSRSLISSLHIIGR